MSKSGDERLCAELVRRFRERGFDAERLPADNVHRIPDLQIRRESERYLVELKQKLDDTEVAQKREDVLARGEVADFTELARRTALDKVIRSAVVQLRTRAGDDEAVFRILWIECEGGNSPGQALQVYNAAFGSCTVIECDGPAREGFYIGESAFFRHRGDLDAIVSYDVDGGRILLNNYSPRFARLRDSGMVRLFRTGGVDAVVDPIALEARGDALIADCELLRSDRAGVLGFVQEKYGLNALDAMNLASMAGVVRIPAISDAPPQVPPATAPEDRWHFYADLAAIREAVRRALPDGWECLSLGMRPGPHEITAKVRRRADGTLGHVRVDLLRKVVIAEDLQGLS